MDEYVSLQEAAARLHLSESTILRLIHAGLLKATRYGRQWRIPVRTLMRGTKPR